VRRDVTQLPLSAATTPRFPKPFPFFAARARSFVPSAFIINSSHHLSAIFIFIFKPASQQSGRKIKPPSQKGTPKRSKGTMVSIEIRICCCCFALHETLFLQLNCKLLRLTWQSSV